MAGQDWSIKIIPSGSAAAFEPDVIGGQPGQPLQAQGDDLVSWNNRTGDKHQPWQTDANYNLQPDAQLSNVIDPWSSSTPAYLCSAPQSGSTTIYYACRFHPDDERGTIVVSA